MIELNKPDYRIDIKRLSKPYNLVKFLKNKKIHNYCYGFWVDVPAQNLMILMNIGMSVGGCVGDRIYRKVGNLPGWGTAQLNGAFGADMKMVVEAFEEKFQHLGIKVHKNLVAVDIWNTTNLQATTFNCPTVDAEKKLFQDCEDTFGNIPVGNFQDPRKRNITNISISVFNNLFENLD
jgi:hypothetical protein